MTRPRGAPDELDVGLRPALLVGRHWEFEWRSTG